MAKQDKTISKKELMANVNRWRKSHNKAAWGHESPTEFKQNFNRIGNKLQVKP